MAARFWVGGTGTWNTSNTASWSTSSGGAGGASVPGVNDSVTFDANSGGGTVTVNTNITVQSITSGAHTGTLDFSANNNNVILSVQFNGSGTGTRTLNLGNGTWTLTGTGNIWVLTTTTNLTFNANSSTISCSAIAGPLRTLILGTSLIYSTISIGANSSGGDVAFNSASNTIATLNITAPNSVRLGATTTITNAMTFTGTCGAPIFLGSSNFGVANTISSANDGTFAWCGIRDLTFAGGGTFIATNSFDLGHNSGLTITPPEMTRSRGKSGFA